MNKLTQLLAVSAVLASSAAMAADFADYDLDKDGYISQSEAKVSETLTQIFERLDRDGDGKLSVEEFKDIES
ncbi:EF-hand domain-containing protein [Pseudoalteromonas fenneropenaei]|uniref:EF-hand domain-containing protein n=1 Tax=Pseudoalteromonas fenneropenaei TaxID=1737459 RepID=A0ABV7CG78_9GAMM